MASRARRTPRLIAAQVAPPAPGTENAPVTRPSTSAERAVGARDILTQLDRAQREHLAWLKNWHRHVLTGESEGVLAGDPDPVGRFLAWFLRNRHHLLVDQPALRQLAELHHEIHELGRVLRAAVDDQRGVDDALYDRFMDLSAAFLGQARRLERAFATASSDLDPLTGVHNRQAMLRDLQREQARVDRSGRPCALAMLDLDHFKQVNDRHGHAAGDAVLSVAADRFIGALRAYDTVYRYGGEEFLVCLPDTPVALAVRVIERLLDKLRAAPIVIAGPCELRVTFSAGVAELVPGGGVDDAIDRADAALYQAKQAGRNRVLPTCDATAPDQQG